MPHDPPLGAELPARAHHASAPGTGHPFSHPICDSLLGEGTAWPAGSETETRDSPSPPVQGTQGLASGGSCQGCCWGDPHRPDSHPSFVSTSEMSSTSTSPVVFPAQGAPHLSAARVGSRAGRPHPCPTEAQSHLPSCTGQELPQTILPESRGGDSQGQVSAGPEGQPPPRSSRDQG